MRNWTIDEPQNLDFSLADGVRALDVRLYSGRLCVVGTDGPARVEISKTATTPIHVELDDGALRIRNEQLTMWPGILEPLWWMIHGGRRFAADVSIAVPYETACTLWLASGSLVVSTVHADVSAECVSGRMTLLGVAGRIRGKVVSGPIEALGCAGDLTLETVSGEITLADSAASQVKVKTVSGSVTADLDNPPDDSRIELETVSGEITIRVREDSDLQVRMNAAHGRVTSDFPGLSAEGKWGKVVNGQLGTGVGQLTARAVGGNIALLRRPVDHDFAETDAA
jgi:Putative adhesin